MAHQCCSKQNQNKYVVEKHWNEKIRKVVPITVKVFYAWGDKMLSVLNNSKFCEQKVYWKWTIIAISCQHRSSEYWAGAFLGDETFTVSGIDPVVVNNHHTIPGL